MPTAIRTRPMTHLNPPRANWMPRRAVSRRYHHPATTGRRDGTTDLSAHQMMSVVVAEAGLLGLLRARCATVAVRSNPRHVCCAARLVPRLTSARQAPGRFVIVATQPHPRT